jgi:hypothetical protein
VVTTEAVENLGKATFLLPSTGASTETTAGHALDPEAVIRRIRSESLLDAEAELPLTAREGLQAMRGMLARALHAISGDLYASSARFLGELIQNADDNTYAVGLVPALAVHVSPGSITCFNNEVGFDERDVRALCDVGSSTKQLRSGAIGRKGIGFKSVFMVTDQPHILSNGFRFCFDSSGDGGLLQPHWVTSEQWTALEVPSKGALPGQPSLWNSDGSTIHLPLKPTVRARPLALTFHAPTLLFLHKLRMFHVVEAEVSGARTMRSFSRLHFAETDAATSVGMAEAVRIAEGDVCVLEEVEYEGGEHGSWRMVTRRSQRWLVHRQQLRVPEGLGQGEGQGGEGPGVTEVAIAFHIQDGDSADEGKEAPCIYAFLPVCNAGLPFLVHCDFHVVSSREQLHTDDTWNLWLRDQLPGVFKVILAFPFRLSPLATRLLPFPYRLSQLTSNFTHLS